MALTTTQVNQAFLATLGRPAEGSAATWGSTSLSLDALLDSIFIAENTDGDFVEYLYQNILGRASDAEGKAFWNSLLATTSKEAVLAQFKAAVLATGQADPANADYQSFIAQNKAFVTDLYTNLLGRTDAASADAEGVEFWANALASGTSKGALLAQFTAAALSDPNSDDAQTLNAKVNVANAITAKFNNFNADVTADEKKAALEALKTTMTEVVAGSTAEDFQERIDTFAGNYQNKVAQVFTTKDDDQLDASEATASTVFSGNVNLIDPAKGTIQTTDSVAGNSNYTDTLRVSVTSDSANKDFSLTSNLPTSVSSIEKLIITAGAANVSGTLDGTNYADATITSTGDVDLKISGDQTELKVTAGDKKDAAITVESGSLDNYTGSAAKDTINVKAGSVKTIDTGAGKDVVTIAAAANIKNEGSIKLGAGDDELTIGVDLAKAETLNKISLDGGEGSKDKLTISTDITAVNSITGFETITTTGTSAKISADAANSLTSGTKLANLSSLTIDMDGKNSLNLKNLKVGNDADNKLGKATVDVLNVAKGEVTLTSTTNNAIVETITLAQTQDGKTGPVTIKGIGAAKLDASNTAKDVNSSGDKLKIADITLSGSNPTQVKNYDKLGTLTADTVYYINTAISSADDLASKSTVLAFMDNNTTLASGKVLVALNNSAQNKSYVFEIKAGTGTANAITRDDITLKAIVDNAINSKDVISGGVIEFVAGTEAKDVKPAGGTTPAKVATYKATELDLSSGSYSGNETLTFTKNTDKLVINAVSGALTIKDGANNVDLFAKTGAEITNSGGSATGTIALYLEGSENASGAITAGNTGITVTSDMVKGASAIYLNTSGAVTIHDSDYLKGGGAAFKAIDLRGKAAADVSGDVSITTLKATSTTEANLATLFRNASSNDTIKATLDSAVKSVKLTAAAETVKLDASSAKVAFTNFTSGTDKIDGSAINTNLKTGASAKGAAHNTQVRADDIFFIDLKTQAFSSSATKAADYTGLATAFTNADTVFASGANNTASTLILNLSGGTTAIYKLTADSTDGLNNDTLALIATIDSATADINAANALFATLA